MSVLISPVHSYPASSGQQGSRHFHNCVMRQYSIHPKRYPKVFVSIFVLSFAIFFSGCSVKYAVPKNCDNPSPTLFPVASVLQDHPQHPCYDWVATTYLRVGTFGFTGDPDRRVAGSFGSFVVWSTDTDNGTALGVSAAHVLEDYYGFPTGVEIPAELLNPVDTPGKAVLRFSSPDAEIPSAQLSPAFLLFHPQIPADESDRPAQSWIKPRHDFQVFVTGNQRREEVEDLKPIRLKSFDLFDTVAFKLDSSIAAVEAGEKVLIVGYPGINHFAPRLFAGVGRVMDAKEIELIMADLIQQGDEEAEIPFDPQAEFILRGRTLEGMSGGGVFNRNGQLIGIIVRGTSKGAEPIVRCIRMTYIVETLAKSYKNANEGLKKEVEPFLDRGLLTN